MEDKLYANFYKAEKTSRDIRRQAADILVEDKDIVDELQQLAFKNKAEKMKEMEESLQR